MRLKASEFGFSFVEMVYSVLDPFQVGVCTKLFAQDGLETAEEREGIRLDGVPLTSQPRM